MTCVREIIQEHSSYGYRRILPELEERTGQTVNHKRLRRLLIPITDDGYALAAYSR